MDFKINVAVDAMGGDHAPDEIILGVLDVLQTHPDIHVDLIGIPDVIERVLSGRTYCRDQLEIIPASEVIEMSESPVTAIRKKKDSSIVVGLKRVQERKADAMVSAGSSGAILVGGQVIVGRIKGVERPVLGHILPTTQGGVCFLLDCGANVDPQPRQLVQFAQMGSIYCERLLGIPDPRVGLVNIGAEEEKGNFLVKSAFPLMKQCKNINFTGSVEARDIPEGKADVIVCDAFVGNVILKLYEGISKSMMCVIRRGLMSTFRSKIGAALAKKALKQTLKTYDAGEYGGAPFLGLNGLVVKAHGNSTAREIGHAILQCVAFKEQRITEMIEEAISENKEAKPDEEVCAAACQDPAEKIPGLQTGTEDAEEGLQKAEKGVQEA